jgi:hypothetical protein
MNKRYTHQPLFSLKIYCKKKMTWIFFKKPKLPPLKVKKVETLGEKPKALLLG